MKKHLSMLSIFYFIFGIIYFIVGLFVNMAINTEFIGIKTLNSVLIGVIVFILPFLAIIAGFYCCYRKKNWSRLFSLCVSCLILIWIPFGLIVGGYGIWVLSNKETKKIFNNYEKGKDSIA